jgi:hypothetical protein
VTGNYARRNARRGRGVRDPQPGRHLPQALAQHADDVRVTVPLQRFIQRINHHIADFACGMGDLAKEAGTRQNTIAEIRGKQERGP